VLQVRHLRGDIGVRVKLCRLVGAAGTIRVLPYCQENVVQKKLTITIDERVYAGLHAVVGRRRISGFIESLVRPHVIDKDLDAAYADMARDETREAEALEWSEGLIGDVADEPR
jgi:hypothetical protein